MTLIKCLSEAEGVFCGKGGLALERGEIVKLRRDLLGRFFLFAYLTFFTDAALANGDGFFLAPEALCSAVWMLGLPPNLLSRLRGFMDTLDSVFVKNQKFEKNLEKLQKPIF